MQLTRYAALLLTLPLLLAADAPAPRSPAAVNAIKKAEKAIADADAEARTKKIAANKTLMEELRKVQRDVMAGGNLDEANSLRAAIDSCEMEIKRLNARVPADALLFEGRYYKFFRTPTTWGKAKAKCEELGGTLVTIANSRENDFLSKKFGGARMWIGLYRVEGNTFQWVDGMPLEYTRWERGEPNNHGTGEDSVSMDSKAGWNDNASQSLFPYVCTWDVPE